MRQWNRTKLNNYAIDSRTEADILKEIQELAESYVPEWKFDKNNPDIGSVIGIMFARHMMDNLDKYNDILEQYHIDFANMIGVSLQPAIPASTMVVLSLADDSLDGVEVPKGVKLLSDADEPVVFETVNNIYVTNAKLVDMFMTSSRKGEFVPILGDFTSPEYVSKDSAGASENTEEQNLAEPDNSTALFMDANQWMPPSDKFPFGLFEFKGNGIEKHAVLIYHSHLFDVENSAIYLRMAGGDALVQGLKNGDYRIQYYSEDGFLDFDRIEFLEEDMIAVYKSQPCKKVQRNGQEYSLIIIEAKENPQGSVMTKKILVSSAGEPQSLSFVNNGTNDLRVDFFQPFGDTLALYKECYLGHNEYFSKPGARVSIQFKVNFETTNVMLTKQEVDEELKIIKRKPKKLLSDAVSDCFVDEISIEYYNGTGWKRLECEKPYKQMFMSAGDGMYNLNFICPEDWEHTTIGADTGYCLRLQILKSDNCYLRPCVHHYPIITDLKVSYTYEDNFIAPECVYGIFGTKEKDLTSSLLEKPETTLFSKSEYGETALYMGFDKRMQEGPISILFQLEEDSNFQGADLEYYYSTGKGFSRLKLADHTNGMTNSNCIRFLPPSDMAPRVIEGKRCYWIKIVDPTAKLEQEWVFRPRIENIFINAVEAMNSETKPEEEYYIDEVAPDMQFNLYATNILSVDIWVNEVNTLSESMKQKMLVENPERIRAEYNMRGEFERFFVKWEEVASFDCSKATDRHYCIDRMNNQVIFGDGVHVMIPRNTQDIAFIARITCCDGAKGNLEPGKINSSSSNLLFIRDIRNPLKSYGGSDMETLEDALRRSASIISNRHRLVSVIDYQREVLAFSNNIHQVEVVNGITKDGIKDEQVISLIILLNDYLENPQTFYHLQTQLKQHLLERCELSIHPSKLQLVAPLFVSISVEMWAEVSGMDETFEMESEMQEILNDFLNPFTGEGWDIGTMPKESQIRLLIQSVKKQMLVRHMNIIAMYQDGQGRHETSLRDLEVTPFMLCKSGNHTIHFIEK